MRECESVLGYIQSFAGVSVSAIFFVTLPAVSSVSLRGCARVSGRGSQTGSGCDSHLGSASLLTERRSPQWLNWEIRGASVAVVCPDGPC